jgi:hypothetical protein
MEETKIQLTDDQFKLFESLGTIIMTATGSNYYHLPIFIEKRDDEFYIVKRENLPESIRDMLNSISKEEILAFGNYCNSIKLEVYADNKWYYETSDGLIETIEELYENWKYKIEF